MDKETRLLIDYHLDEIEASCKAAGKKMTREEWLSIKRFYQFHKKSLKEAGSSKKLPKLPPYKSKPEVV